MKINQNIPALRTINTLTHANKKAETAMLRLSSGLKINKAKDDTAGSAISNKMDAQIKGLSQANRNAMDGLSLVQTAEGAYSEVHDILQRMRELSVKAANGTNDIEEKETIQQEIDMLAEELCSIQSNTEFNKKNLLDGPTSAVKFQIGANQGQVLEIPVDSFDLRQITSITNVIDVKSTSGAQEGIDKLDEAINKASDIRSKLGSYQNRLEFTVRGLESSEQTTTEAMSRITDADMAYEMAEYTKYNILNQSATSMLAHANQRPETVLQLLNR